MATWKGGGANAVPMGPLNPILARMQTAGGSAAQPPPPPAARRTTPYDYAMPPPIQPPVGMAGVNDGEPQRKKRKRWGTEEEKGTSMVTVLPSSMTPVQQECYLCS